MGTRILIVDDNRDHRYFLESLLKEGDNEVIASENGAEALGKARLNPPDLIISDILMPVMDGFALCRAWKSDSTLKRIPFLFYTATYTDPKDEAFAMSLGADRFLLKPQEPDVLLKVIDEVLAESRADKRSAAGPLGEEMEFFRQYNEVLFRKLEKKLSDLEASNRQLRRMEAAVRESESRLKSLSDNLPDGMVYQVVVKTDGSRRFTYVSDSVKRLHGLSPEEVLADAGRLYDRVHPEDAGLLKKAESEALSTLSTFRAEVRMKDPSGGFRWSSLASSPHRLEDGSIRWDGIEQVITERKEAEHRLREGQKFNQLLLDSSPAFVVAIGADGKTLLMNRSLLDALEYTQEEVQGVDYLTAFVPEEDRAAVERVFQGLIRRESPSVNENRIIGRTGRIYLVEWHGRPVFREGGGIDFFVGLGIDITDRRRAEEDLRESERKYRLLADNLGDVIFVTDLNLHFSYVSPSVRTLLGRDPEAILNTTAIEMMAPASAGLAVNTLSKILERERSGLEKNTPPQLLDLEIKRTDGTTVWTEMKASFIRDEHGNPTGVLGVLRDITERRQAEAELQRALERLRKSFDTTIRVMVSAVESRDPYTAGHQMRVADLAAAIAEEMGMSPTVRDGVRMAGFIHDIGKLSVPAEILSKPTKLSEIELLLIREHPRNGYEMLKDVEGPWPLADIVHQHHERMNGSGYPQNLHGEDIRIEARILAVADVVESMSSPRPYRPALGIDAALEEIEKHRDTLYDGAAVDACLRLFREKGFRLKGD